MSRRSADTDHCADCQATRVKMMYSGSDDQTGAPDRKPDKRRSFLQQPKSYVSKLPAPGYSYGTSSTSNTSAVGYGTSNTSAQGYSTSNSSAVGYGTSSLGITKPRGSVTQLHSPTARVDNSPPKTQPIPIPQTSPSGQNTFPAANEPQEFFIGDRVSVGGVKTGTLLYFGTIHVASGLWCGISLDEPEGIHDGLVNDVRYFTCRNGHGIFAPVEKVSHLDTKAVLGIIKAAPKVSQIPNKPTVCQSNPISDEIIYTDRSLSSELSDEQDIDDDILGLDEHGIIRDDEDEVDGRSSLNKPGKSKRKLPKLPRAPSHGISRLQYIKKDTGVNRGGVDETIMDEAAEKLQMLADGDNGEEVMEGNRTFIMEEKYDSSTELQHSAGGSSGGEDSWSLSKDYLAMCDGRAQYLNITFDGESESKNSTQEPSEESPSPEFIFDQEMIEDGEFATEPIADTRPMPMEMSRDSSLGLISSFALDKNDLLNELFGDEDEDDLVTSQETIEPMSEDKDISPEKTPERQDFDTSVDLEDGDGDVTVEMMAEAANITTSTPMLDNANKRKNIAQRNLNETYDREDFCESSPITTNNKVGLNSTYTQDSEQFASSQLNEAAKQNVNDTFTMATTKDEARNSLEVNAGINMKDGVPGKGFMVDSGICMRGSMTDSANNSLRNSMVDSTSAQIKNLQHDAVLRRSMLDSGSAHVDSTNNSGQQKTDSVNDPRIIKDSTNMSTKVSFDVNSSESRPIPGVSGHVLHAEMNDVKLKRDLSDGHTRKERPISFLSDTGYVPDTDSEHGTLTVNSPQEWTDKGFHGNALQGQAIVPPVSQKDMMPDYQDENGRKLVPVNVESDSDLGTMTGDTDTEADRLELLRSEGVVMENIAITMENIHEDVAAESEDEITQIEDVKALNSTVTLSPNDEGTSVDPEKIQTSPNTDSTFTKEGSEPSLADTTDSNDLDTIEEGQGEGQSPTSGSIAMVTVVIEDKEKGEGKDENGQEGKSTEKKVQKTQKKKKFNVVKDFKKPNTTNVVSKLSEYLKTPVPVKPREDKINTEEAKNKRNSLKSKIDLSKVTSKINNKGVIEETKKGNGDGDKADNVESPEKEKETPKRFVKREKPKSKWDAIMSKIEGSKDSEKEKPKTEVKSKVEAFQHIPPPAPPKKEEPPKPKRRISAAIPDYSKVVSKLKYSAPPVAPPKPKKEEPANSNSNNNAKNIANKKRSPRKISTSQSPSRSVTDSPKRKPSINGPSGQSSTSASPSRSKSDLSKTKDISPARSPIRSKSDTDRSREKKPNKDKNLKIKNERVRSLSGDSSAKRPEIRDKAVHIDLNDSLDGRGSRVETGSLLSSCQSSRTDMSTTEEDVFNMKQLPQIERTMSLQEGRTGSSSDLSEAGSQANEIELQLQRVVDQHRRDSGLLQPSTYQNRNKTNKKKESKEKEKPPETVLAEVHTREVHRLEALCESRTKQLNMVKLQLQTSNLAFDGMATTVNYLAHDLDGFSCPGFVKETERLAHELSEGKTQISTLEGQKSELQEIIGNMKEQHKDYINSLESENEKSLQYQLESLNAQHEFDINEIKARKVAEISQIRNSHENYIAKYQSEHEAALDTLRSEHSEAIRQLQRKQENQMEELHKQHQDKLEDITGRFDSIKLTLSEKVETLRTECDRLRDRARHCEDALQRDSDYKVQCALVPYKHLPEEIESLKMVVEMRNEEINKLRNSNLELAKKLEELPIAQEKIISLQQKKENLEAIISMKTEHEKVLHERCQSLMRKYDKESRANKRLSMEYEELMWKLSESFNESDLGSQEAQFYQKLGMSPSNSDGSPVLGRRVRTPSSCDGSPSKSPGYRRTLSSSVDDREEKKLKRRSGNFLLDHERKHVQQRATSPLAAKQQSQNALTKSWSPGTQSNSSPSHRASAGPSSKMSQSWCVDMEPSLEEVEKIPRSASTSGKPNSTGAGTRKSRLSKELKDSDSDSDKGFVSNNDTSNSNSHGLDDTGELSESLKSTDSLPTVSTPRSGTFDKSTEDCPPATSTPRSGQEASRGSSEENNVFTGDDEDKNSREINNKSTTDSDDSDKCSGEGNGNTHNTHQNTTSTTSSNGQTPVDEVTVTSETNKSSSPCNTSVNLSSETVSCPVSRLPVSTDAKVKQRSHTETTV